MKWLAAPLCGCPVLLLKLVLALLIAGKLAVTARPGRLVDLGGMTQYSKGNPSKYGMPVRWPSVCKNGTGQ